MHQERGINGLIFLGYKGAFPCGDYSFRCHPEVISEGSFPLVQVKDSSPYGLRMTRTGERRINSPLRVSGGRGAPSGDY